MSTHIITPGPYRATKLWNEVTGLFRAGMPLRKHRQNFRLHVSCFSASAAVDWLHQLLQNNSNFGPDVTRQQTVQLMKKFLKNHVIEDVKGRWGTEELEDNHLLYRFPTTSPLKPIPRPAATLKKRSSFRDREGIFKFRNVKKQDASENLDPAPQTNQEVSNQPIGEQKTQRRELTSEDERDVWRDITLTHLQRILGVASLDDVLDRRNVNPQNIVHNMTKVNKHGVVSLEDKTGDLPHWVISAMKSLANWPKYDSEQPSYPGFERDVFKTVSDYFHDLPQPLLTYEFYELFINVLVFSGYVAAAPPKLQRRRPDPPAKATFRSTECLLLSLLRHGACEEAESPMSGVLSEKLRRATGSGRAKPQTRSLSVEILGEESASPPPRQESSLCVSVEETPPPLNVRPNVNEGIGRRASSCMNICTLPSLASHAPFPSLHLLPAARRCLSSLDVSKPTAGNADGVLQPQCERIAVEALQLCTLLLPPASRRKLQLLMRMMSRISQNVDMPRLHPAIGTRTLMVHTFCGCVLSGSEECDLDDLLATRLVSFLMDHQQNVLSVPEYLLSAIGDHIQYLRAAQVPLDSGDPVCVPMYAFCRQISGAEFEQQKQESSQKAMEELLEILLRDRSLSEKIRQKRLKQFQKQYPDIYRRRVPSEPKIKAPLLTVRKSKSFRN